MSLSIEELRACCEKVRAAGQYAADNKMVWVMEFSAFPAGWCESMKDIEQIINYKFSMYFLRFSEAIISIRGKDALVHDWYDYVEYGTNNEMVILLQKYGFLREHALSLLKAPYSEYIMQTESGLTIHNKIFDVADKDTSDAIKTVQINYPEIFIH